MKRTYYFINSDIDPDTIYGSEQPRCLPATEIARLAEEFENPDLLTQFHEASDSEIAEYGVYDDGLVNPCHRATLKKRLTKIYAFLKIKDFGRSEQHALIEQGKHHEAYQIEHARMRLHIALLTHGIKGVRQLLPRMIEYTIDAKGLWDYDPWEFVMDEHIRDLLKEFAAKF